MKKKLKLIALTVGIILTIGLLLGGIYLWMLANAFSNPFGDTEEELNDYANLNFGRHIEELERTERKWGRHRTKDVLVKTLDRQGVVFTIYINRSGETKGDDFHEQAQKIDTNQKYWDNVEIRKLIDMGFMNVRIGERRKDRDISIGLPVGFELSDSSSFEVIFEALPFIRSLDEKLAEDTGYPLEELYVNGELLDLAKDYETPEDIGKQLAAENITIFYPNFYSDDKNTVRDKLDEIEIVAFEMDWTSPRMTCYKLKSFDTCGKYELTLPTQKHADGTIFSYDDEDDLNQLLEVIQLVKQVDVPIEKIRLKPVLVPNKREDGSEMDELIEKTVRVHNLHKIKSIEDIQFEYR